MDPATEAENRDLLAYLRRSGFAALISAAEDPDCLRGGILSGKALAKRMGVPARRACQTVRQARDAIAIQLNGGIFNDTSIPPSSNLFSLTSTPTTSRSASDCN